MYILYTYIGLFALSTMLFEANHTWIEKLAMLSKYQDLLIKNCSFLTHMAGRGLFYAFQATLWLSTTRGFLLLPSNIVGTAAGGALGAIGILHVLGHWGVMPHHVAQKAMATAEKATGRDL